ncbi:hypothetical protein GCM10029992_40890 [Glycomyces albus]
MSYDHTGCSISKASASVLFELVKGASVDDARARFEEFSALMSSKGLGEADEDSSKTPWRSRVYPSTRCASSARCWDGWR